MNSSTTQTSAARETSIFTEGEKGTMIVPPRMIGMMAGCSHAFRSGNKFRLTYSDGSHEEAVCELPSDVEFLAIVSAVQSRR